MAFLLTSYPFADINMSICIGISTMAVHVIIIEISFIHISVTALRCDASYDVRVRAANALGAGPWSGPLRVGGLKKALDRILTAFVEELPGLDVRIGSFKAGDWPVCEPLPLDTYMNTREETFRAGGLGWVVLQLVVRERVNAGRSTGPGSYPDNLAAFSTWVRERVFKIKEAEKMATDY